MHRSTFAVDIVDGKVVPNAPHVLPENGKGVLMLIEVADAPPLKSVEIVEGPDGLLVFRGGGKITSEMVKAAQDELDLEDAVRYQYNSRPAVGRS